MEITTAQLREDFATGFYHSANEAWENLYYGLNLRGDESAPRGLKVRETLGCNIYIVNPYDNLVYNSFRRSSPYYVAQEYFWYHSGDRNVESIAKYAGFWRRIANEDGTVNSNYGAYIFDKNYKPIDGMSRWEYLVDTLKRDPDSRQAILQIPIIDTLGTKDVCCTSNIQFFIRNGVLMTTVYMRSNDLNKGFCNDIPFFTSLQINLAKELGVKVGWYRHCVGSMHIYEPDFLEVVEEKKGWKFNFEHIEFDDNNPAYNYLDDYEILKNRKSDGVINKKLLYMAKNFDTK